MDKGVLSTAIRLYEEAESLPRPDLSQVDLRRGFQVSAAACAQASEVPMSPIMKNIIEWFDKPETGWRLMVDSPTTKGEHWVAEQVEAQLIARNGPKATTYDDSYPLDDTHHYDVDCWRNYKENMRQIVPGQADERKEVATQFGVKLDPYPLFKQFEEDRLMSTAIDIISSYMPEVSADTTFEATALPFMRKHTNVGFKWWYNDKSVDASTGKTYGQLAQDAAELLTTSTVPQWNVYTMYGRNQRGKGRLLVASARPINLYLNRLEANEIEKLKSVGLFAGYNDTEYLRSVLEYILDFCRENGLKCQNFDQSKYDMHINPAWLSLIGALRCDKTRGALGKRLCEERTRLNIHGWCVNGMTGKIEEIHGRMFSGFIDTNQGDGWVSAIINLYVMMKLDPDYVKKVLKGRYFMLVMGDDCLVIYDPAYFSEDAYVSIMRELGFEVNMEKGEFGVYFLQYRLFRKNGTTYMVYPWTRVLRSLLFTESKRGLGPAGWLLSQYQQLSKVMDYAPALDAIVSIIYPFDKLKLGVDLTVDQILEMVRNEDLEAANESKGSQYMSTADRLDDGDPSKQHHFADDGEFDNDFVGKVHSAVVESVKRCGRQSKPSVSDTRH